MSETAADTLPETVTPETLADLIGVTEKTVIRYASTGSLPPTVAGRMPLRESVRAHISRLRAGQARGSHVHAAERSNATLALKATAMALDHLAGQITRTPEDRLPARLLLEGVLARLRREQSYVLDSERSRLRRIASEIAAEGERLISEPEGGQ